MLVEKKELTTSGCNDSSLCLNHLVLSVNLLVADMHFVDRISRFGTIVLSLLTQKLDTRRQNQDFGKGSKARHWRYKPTYAIYALRKVVNPYLVLSR